MYLFITSTTYAQRLPGDQRGFVSRVNSEIHNEFGTPVDTDVPWLRTYTLKNLKGEPVFLNGEHAKVLLEQFQQTVAHRHWELLGVAIMPNHVHILLETDGTVSPDTVAGTLKSWGSRRLSKVFGKPKSETWWTTGCSIRHKTADSLPTVIQYIKEQHNPLLIWIAPEYESV
jgi:REP element-mobilizing transposase RayT